MRKPLWLAWLSVIALVLAWLVTCGLGDRVWWALPLLYGPRWLPALMAIGCLPALLLVPKRGWLPSVLALGVVLFGLLDVRLGLGRWTAGHGTPLRVMELNADGGRGDVRAILATITANHPDVIVVAECGEGLKEAMKSRPEFHFHAGITSLCLFSRPAIVEWVERNPQDIWVQGGSGSIVRATLETDGGAVRLGMVHLETPRDALEMYRDLSEIPKLGPLTNANTRQREEESALAQHWMEGGPTLPTIIAGDFNLPRESAIYRRHWGGYRNAFSESGIGSGYTKHTRHWGARIDHVLSSEDVHPARAFVGGDVGSDHRPLIVDLVLPAVSAPTRRGTR